MEDEPVKKNNTVITVVVVVAVLGLLAAGAFALAGKKDEDGATNTSKSQTAVKSETSTPSSSQTTGATYKDGTYSADGGYTSPGGSEKIHVTITVAGNKVASSEVTTDPASPTSSQYQQSFKDNYKNLIVGKAIDGLSLSKVSGSSLTSKGFNEALDNIRTQAKA